MQENEFEDEIGKNMEGFGIDPSPQVWPEVERRIRKDRKRRFVLWFWLLLFLLTCGIITAVLFHPENKTQIATNQTENNKNEKLQNPILKDSSFSPNFESEYKKISEEISGNKQTAVEEKNTVPGKEDKILKENKRSLNFNKEVYHKSLSKNSSGKENINNGIFHQQQSNITNKNDETLIQPQIEPSPILKEDSNTVNTITSHSKAVDENNKEPNLENVDSINKKLAAVDSLPIDLNKQTPNQKLKKWSWGLNFAMGRSGFSKGILNFDKTLYADAIYNSGTGSGQYSRAVPSPVNPSLYWSTGAFIQKPISKKLNISISLDYAYLSTKNKIGSRVDSSKVVNKNLQNEVQVAYFYRPSGLGTSKNYTNQFHFISLSADVAWEIVASKNFTLFWENGIAFTRLISSSTLHYSSTLPGYYKDNTQLIKNQLAFKTGLVVPVGEKLRLKPFLNYNLSAVFKNYSGSNTHFSTYGLQLKYILKK